MTSDPSPPQGDLPKYSPFFPPVSSCSCAPWLTALRPTLWLSLRPHVPPPAPVIVTSGRSDRGVESREPTHGPLPDSRHPVKARVTSHPVGVPGSSRTHSHSRAEAAPPPHRCHPPPHRGPLAQRSALPPPGATFPVSLSVLHTVSSSLHPMRYSEFMVPRDSLPLKVYSFNHFLSIVPLLRTYCTQTPMGKQEGSMDSPDSSHHHPHPTLAGAVDFDPADLLPPLPPSPSLPLPAPERGLQTWVPPRIPLQPRLFSQVSEPCP